MDQTIFVLGIPSPSGQFGNATILPGVVTIFVGVLPSSEAFGFSSVGNITLTGYAIPSAEFVSPKARVNSITRFPVVTPLIQDQFPAFVKEDHENFMLFMEAYYEWLENYGEVIYQAKNLLNIQDIDTTVNNFVEFFQKEFLVNLPRQIIADKALVLKNIREYYRARGTEKSYKFFFRIMFGEEASFYFPRVDILRVSDGKWIQPLTLKVSAITGNPFDLIGRRIRGITNNSTAFVENVTFVQEGFIAVYELYLNRSSVTGVFDAEEILKTTDGSNITCSISPIPVEIQIVNPGEGYQVGQLVDLVGTGSGAKGKITSVDTNGEVLKVSMISYGAGYFGGATPFFPLYAGVTTQATGTATIGSLTNYPGFYLNEDGQLSTTKFLQDGYFYQQFSYVVQVNESVETYRDALKKALHPAGLIFFGTVLSENNVNGGNRLPLNRDGTTSPSVVIHTPSRASFNCRSHPEVVLLHWIKEDEQAYKLGPTYRSLERDKFRYKPFERYDANQDMAGGNNSDYWSGPIQPYANYQIKDFGDLIIKDVVEKPWTKINIMPEPVLRNSDLTGIETEENFGEVTIIQS